MLIQIVLGDPACDLPPTGFWDELMKRQRVMGHCGLGNPGFWPEQLASIIPRARLTSGGAVNQKTVGTMVRPLVA